MVLGTELPRMVLLPSSLPGSIMGEVGLGSAFSIYLFRNGQHRGRIEPWVPGGHQPRWQLPSRAAGHVPLGAEIRLLAEKFLLGKSIKGNFSNFSIQNKEGSLFFPLTLFKHLVSVLLEVIPAPRRLLGAKIPNQSQADKQPLPE